MDNIEREEVKTIVHDVTIGPLSRIEASINVIEFRLASMDNHMKVANGNTAKNVLKIAEVEKELINVKQEIKGHEIKCPQSETIGELKDVVDELKDDKLGRDKLKQVYSSKAHKDRIVREEKRAKFLKTLETIGVVIAALALLVNLWFSVRSNKLRDSSSGNTSETNIESNY